MGIRNRSGRIASVVLTCGAVIAGLCAVPVLSTVSPAAAATGGGSIVYVKDNNVWITDGDGSEHRQVTTGGTDTSPWQSPTQSDAGVVVAFRAGLIYRMNQRGEVFNTIDPPDLALENGVPVSGLDLTETAISPDGQKIAYTYFKVFQGTRFWATGYTASTYASDPLHWGVSFQDKPSWVTNSRVALNAWNRLDSHLYDLGQRDMRWFSEGDYTSNRKELSDLEVSRDGRFTVGVRGEPGFDSKIVVITNRGDVQSAVPAWKPIYGVDKPCVLNLDGPEGLWEPAVAPDGSTVAWTEETGIYRASDMNCGPGTRLNILVAEGGSDPHWSVAQIGQTPDVEPTQQPTQTPTQQPTQQPTQTAGPTAGPTATQTAVPVQPLKLASKPHVSGKARVGKVLKVKPGTWTPAASAYAYRWTRNGKPIAKASKSRYRLTKADRGRKIAVTVTATRAGWLSSKATSNVVRVKR